MGSTQGRTFAAFVHDICNLDMRSRICQAQKLEQSVTEGYAIVIPYRVM